MHLQIARRTLFATDDRKENDGYGDILTGSWRNARRLVLGSHGTDVAG
jgi:hypothetical protein